MPGSPHLHCPYCHQPTLLLRSGEVGYPYPADWGPAWACLSCNAFVGCYSGSTHPLGSLANADLREWRRRAHAAFDTIWQTAPNPREARRVAYRWLATALGVDEPHIARMDADSCRRVIEACTSARPTGVAVPDEDPSSA